MYPDLLYYRITPQLQACLFSFQTSERIEIEAGRLSSALELWNEINSIVNDVECWSSTSVSELSDGPVNLLSSVNMEDCLSQFKVSKLSDLCKHICKKIFP